MSKTMGGSSAKIFASATSEAVVVTSDTVDQPLFKSLWITTVGNITVSRDGGVTNVLYPSATLSLGEFLIASPCRIMATGTTAVMIRQNW